MPWRPGGHAVALALESPYEDVPTHLRQPLLDWTQYVLRNENQFVGEIALHFRLDLPTLSSDRGKAQAIAAVMNRCETDSDFQLEIINYALSVLPFGGVWALHRSSIERTLTAGNSAYKVREDHHALEMRVAPGVQETVQAAVSSATGSAGAHLTDAWNETYALSPDPVKAFSESIKAVEAAMAPVISPNNLKATLGTLIGDVRANPSKYEFIVQDGANSDGVQTVLAMMAQLWEGQTSRHGGVLPTRPETLDEAQAALHLAATLVQWASSGAFKVK